MTVGVLVENSDVLVVFSIILLLLCTLLSEVLLDCCNTAK